MKRLWNHNRWLVAPVLGVFLLANGLLHMSSPDDVLDDITQLTYALQLTDPLLWSVAFIRLSVAAEIMVGSLLLFKTTRSLGQSLFLGLFGSYTIYLGLTWIVLGESATCACQGYFGRLPVWAGILRNVALAGLALAIPVRPPENSAAGYLRSISHSDE